jgi:uncharacterized protein (TIRG00374 family)
LKTSLRVAITLLLVALLLYMADARMVLKALAGFDPFWGVIALAALTLDRVLMSYKWGLLLAMRGCCISLVRRLMIYCSAMMWGLTLPSTVGADAIRVILARRFGLRADDTIATILVERGVGFICALLTAVVGLVILRRALPEVAIYDAAVLGGVAALLAAIALVGFSFSNTALASVLRLLPVRMASSRLAGLVSKLHDAYCSLAIDRGKLALFSGLTLLEQILMIACYGLVGVALGVEIDAFFLFAAVPLAILVSRLPISIDGIGVYEGIFMAVMALGGVKPEDSLAISLGSRALQIIVWLPWWLALTAQTGVIRPRASAVETST